MLVKLLRSTASFLDGKADAIEGCAHSDGDRAAPDQKVASEAIVNLYPFNEAVTDTYCFICGSTDEAVRINATVQTLREKENVSFKAVCEEANIIKTLDGADIEVIGFDDIAKQNIATVILPSRETEEKTALKLEEISRSNKYNFNIFDSYNTSFISDTESLVSYRGVDLTLLPTVLYPTLYTNWGFISHMVNDVIGDRKLKTLDMFAGSGVLGYCLANETNITDISFADANFWAVRAIRQTAKRYPDLNTRACLSEGLRGVPSNEKFDLIVGNPPHTDKPLRGPEEITGADPAWESHTMFFEDAADYLTQDGRIIFIESIPSGIYEAFYSKLENDFPAFKIHRYIPMKDHYCFAIEIGLV